MRNFLNSLFFGLFILFSSMTIAQEKLNLSGYVRDAANGEELIGASVSTDDYSKIVSTNVYGFYSLPLTTGTYKIMFSYIGYDDVIKEFTVDDNQTFDIELQSSSVNIDEALVTGESENRNVKDIEMSVNEMDIKTILKIPALLGEADVIRSVQTMPGVATVGEGATGFNVRGGGVDENLILLDEAPVYNSSHLLGFFSVFNPDAVKNVKLIKGGIPAEYGGRLSSILDVRNKDGNKKKFAGQGGIGSIFSRLTLEGPIKKDKASFILAGRRSYIDILAKPFFKKNLGSGSKFNFFDLTGKVNWRMNDNNNFFISAYKGGDVIGVQVLDFVWGNTTTTARWNHIFNNTIFMNITGVFSDYQYSFDIEDGDDGFKWKSRIQNYSAKADFSYFANQNNTLKFGVSSIFYDFVPADVEFKSGGELRNSSQKKKYSMESAAFIQNEQKISKRLTLQYGLRFSMYQYLGGREIYTLDEAEVPGTRAAVTAVDSTTYGRWDAVETYGNFEPRIAANFSLSDASSIKASYNRMTQYVHLLSNSVAATPIDIWTPVTNNIKPSIADQVALGYFRNFKDNTYEASAEVYYKKTQNVVDYINSADLFINDLIEADLLSGEGKAYGLELYVKKSKGLYTGWISYTLSRSERIVKGINNDEWFPNRYDRTHNMNINFSRQLNERWSMSAAFTYASGTPSTFPTNRVDIQGWTLPHNVKNERNSFRIPAYHRADLGFTRDGEPKANKKWTGQWVFSIYNLYSRRNPYLFFFRQNEEGTGTEAVRYSVIASVIPSVTYNFNF